MASLKQHWTAFERWCAEQGMKPLPAHAWTIASYLRKVDKDQDVKEVKAAMDAIAREHVLRTSRSPVSDAIVQKTFEMIERRADVQDQHANLFEEKSTPPKSKKPPQNIEIPQEKPVQATGHRRMMTAKPRLVRRRPKASD